MSGRCWSRCGSRSSNSRRARAGERLVRPKKPRIFALAVAVAALVVTPTPTRAQLSSGGEAWCLTPFEGEAFHLRLLQSFLMLNALICGRDENYNQFVRRHRIILAQSHQVIHLHFHRHDGENARQALDAFITNIAAWHSRAATEIGQDYCPGTAAVWAQVRSADDAPALAAIAEDVTRSDYAQLPPPC